MEIHLPSLGRDGISADVIGGGMGYDKVEEIKGRDMKKGEKCKD